MDIAPDLAMAVAMGCTVLFFLLGTNHLFAFMANPAAQFRWPPLVLNYIGLIFSARVILGRQGQLTFRSRRTP